METEFHSCGQSGEPAWFHGTSGPWTVEKWLAGLRERGVAIDEEGYRQEGRLLGGPDAIVEAWEEQFGPLDLCDGYIPIATFELWQMLLPDVACPERLIAELVGVGLMDRVIEESKWLDAALAASLDIAGMAKTRCPEAPLEWISGLAAAHAPEPFLRWMLTLPDRLVAAGRREQAVQLGLAWQALDRGERRPTRNEPCPCGSGKKYKRCCGG